MKTGRIVPRLATVCLGVALWLMLATPVSAAAPWIIIVDGEPLSEPIYIAEFFDNYDLMVANEPGDIVGLGSRPYLNLYLFWGPDWADYVSSGKQLEDLAPEQSNQQGRFYPAYEDQPAILELAGGQGPGVVNETGLEILQRYGVPIELSTAPPLPGMPNTGAGGMSQEPTTKNGSLVVLVIGLAVICALVFAAVSRRFKASV